MCGGRSRSVSRSVTRCSRPIVVCGAFSRSPTYRPALTLPRKAGVSWMILGDAPRLVEGQGVHRIDEDGLHAFLPGMAPAVIQNRPQEALRLARPRAGGHDGGTPAVRRAGIEALVRDALMAVRREAERHLRERLAAFGRELRRQRDGEVRAFDEVLLLGEEVVQNVRERRVGGAEAGGEEVPQRVGDLVGDDGGDHGAVAGSVAWVVGRWWA